MIASTTSVPMPRTRHTRNMIVTNILHSSLLLTYLSFKIAKVVHNFDISFNFLFIRVTLLFTDEGRIISLFNLHKQYYV